MDHSTQHYYEAYELPGGDGYGPWYWKVYHYDVTGNKEVIVALSTGSFDNKEYAYDDACEWLEENNIDAEMV